MTTDDSDYGIHSKSFSVFLFLFFVFFFLFASFITTSLLLLTMTKTVYTQKNYHQSRLKWEVNKKHEQLIYLSQKKRRKKKKCSEKKSIWHSNGCLIQWITMSLHVCCNAFNCCIAYKSFHHEKYTQNSKSLHINTMSMIVKIMYTSTLFSSH